MLKLNQKWLFFEVFIVYCHIIIQVKSQDIKTWRADTNFLNSRNWENDQLPCENDRIIFPATNPVITFMPESLTAAELILPVNGEIIFPKNAAIELTGGTRQGSCSGKDAYFKTTVDYWFEPTNWNITTNNAFPRIPNRQNAAVPHAFQVPCPTDKVRFPAGKTFRVHLDYPATTVASLDVNDVTYSQNEFDELVHTHIGSLLFPDNPNIRITSAHCSDETGCICGNDGPRVLPTICMFVTPYCPDPGCSDPITPAGNCCPICGAVITMKYQQNFKLKKLIDLHHRFLGEAEFDGESFTSKTHEENIQSVFVDTTKTKGFANKVAQTIYKFLESDMNGESLYGIRSIEMLKSEKWGKGVPIYDKSRGMSSGGVASLIILLIVVLGLGAAFYVYRKRHIPGFNFARFDLRGDKIELELGTTPHDDLQPGDDTPTAAGGSSEVEKSKGFDNPVYGTTVEEVSPLVEESVEVKDFVENPMFNFFEDSAQNSNQK